MQFITIFSQSHPGRSIMIAFVTVFFGLIFLQASLQILLRFCSDRLLLDEKAIKNFDASLYPMIFDLIGRYNCGFGHPQIKINVRTRVFRGLQVVELFFVVVENDEILGILFQTI